MRLFDFARENNEFLSRERLILAFLFIGALAVRVYLVFHTYLISKDGIIYIDMAKKFAGGDYHSALSYDFHPLYPLLIALSQKVFVDWTLSSQIVSSFLGALTVVPLYYLGKKVFGPKAAAAGAILYIFSSYAARFSADSLSEATYLFFFISAMAVGLSAVESNRAPRYAAAGALSALAYLTRPEGVGLIIIIAVWALLPFGKKILALRRIASIIAVALAFLLFSSPYLYYLRSANGALNLTKKKDIGVLIGVEDSASKPGAKQDNGGQEGLSRNSPAANFPERKVQAEAAADADRGGERPGLSGRLGSFLSHVSTVLGKFVETLNPFLFAVFLLGLLYRKRIARFGKGELFIASAFFLYLPLLVRLLQTYTYTSRRYQLALVALALLWCGAGIAEAHQVLLKVIRKRDADGYRRRPAALFAILMVLPVLALAPFTFKPNRAYKLADKEVALWMKHNGGQGALIMSSDPRIAFYAGGRHVDLPGSVEAGALDRAAGSAKADYLVLDVDAGQGEERNRGIERSSSGSGLKLVYLSKTAQEDGRARLAVYRMQSAAMR